MIKWIKSRNWETSKVIFAINEVLGIVVLGLIMFGWLKSENRMDSAQMFTADISFMGLNAVVYGTKAGFENCHKNPKGSIQNIANDINTVTNLTNGLASGDVGSTINTINDAIQQINQNENESDNQNTDTPSNSNEGESINNHM